ncbi:nucleolar protein 6 [Anopheles nili]|uniref:nucleolar protein 6 n=1 Tax=Anopheles nili TaxID=185578 RepID=UPI00237BB55A|nr:nucleolar protein 6 [Anopheles nili]
MNRIKKKATEKMALVNKKKKKPMPVETEYDSYDSMVENGTDEDDEDDSIANDSQDSGLESGAFVHATKPLKKMSKAAKRKMVAHDDDEAHRKRVKAVKELYKPPTVEELNRLKETENYYHSNLFRMQTEEMLKEVRVPTKLGRFVQVWIEEFKEVLQTVEDGTSDRWLLDLNYDGVEFPLSLDKLENVQELIGNERFRFVQQRHVRTIGGSDGMLRTSFGKPLIVDLLLVIPEKCFHKEDYLNLRYHCKRAHYLCTIAQRLLQSGGENLVSGIRFEALKGDQLKPVLVMQPADARFRKKVHFQLHAIIDGSKFPKKRFLPHRNNVRPALIGRAQTDCTEEDYENFPTPHYNSSILYDVRLAKNAELLEGIIQSDSIREAIILLKVWARQRHFDRGRYGFDGGLITFYIAYLLQSKRIYPNMSSYQVIRLFWNQLAGSSWDTEGISFDESSKDTLLSFFRYYEVVFLDPLGTLNITANLPVDLYRRVRQESALAIRLLDNRKINSFLALFLASYSAFSQYDHIVIINDARLIHATIDSFAEDADRLNYCGDRQALFTRMVERLLRKGLGTRASYLVPLATAQPDECTLTAEPRFALGISLNRTDAFNLVDKGPEAIDAAASEAFRAFWHGKAELRRFKDGSITESCVWGEMENPIGQKRLIVRSIVLFLLNAHLDIKAKKVSYLAAQFEAAIKPWPVQELDAMHETIEERSLAVIRTFDTLGRMMRDLDQLPLTINAILGTDAVFRYADPDPPRPTASGLLVNGQLVFLSGKPILATIQLATSGKWPTELEAIRRLKAAFYLRIASCMENVRNGTSKPVAHAYNDYLDVLYEKYLFRFVIIHQREISILREYLSENKVTRLQQDTDESVALEMQATILPKLTSILHGLHQQHFSFGSVASIAKRWLYAQLIDPYLWPDECTELLLAALYLNQPLQPPVQPQTGFLRWLQYVASTDWSKELIVVNFNDELTSDTIDQLEKQFYDHRQSFPPLTIVTPCDAGKYGLFGRRAPTVEILNRVTLLAQAAIGIIESNLPTLRNRVQDFFQPCLEGYNVIIHLDSTIVLPIGVRASSEIGVRKQPSLFMNPPEKEPAAGFDVVRFYLHELREAYGQFAIFFYDPCGGDKIGVLWRPQALEEKPFTTTNVNGRLLGENGTLQLNIDALLRDFEILGQGLVKRVERR